MCWLPNDNSSCNEHQRKLSRGKDVRKGHRVWTQVGKDYQLVWWCQERVSHAGKWPQGDFNSRKQSHSGPLFLTRCQHRVLCGPKDRASGLMVSGTYGASGDCNDQGIRKWKFVNSTFIYWASTLCQDQGHWVGIQLWKDKLTIEKDLCL